jgi:hypothetical protein
VTCKRPDINSLYGMRTRAAVTEHGAATIDCPL